MLDSRKVEKFASLNRDNVLGKVSQEDIFRFYVREEPKVGSLVRSPMRDDRNPTCSFFYSGPKLKFKDFATGFRGDCFDLVQKMYQTNFNGALQIINQDLNLNLGNRGVHDFRKHKIVQPKIIKEPTKIQITLRKYNAQDLKFWNSFGISQKTLKLFNVYAVEKLYVNKRLFAVSRLGDPIYAYYFPGSKHFKIYRPFNKNFKWISNVNADDIQGFSQLKLTDKLIITSSLKDVMSLYSVGYTAIAPQGEACMYSKKLLQLVERYPEVYIMYDNDEPGRINAQLRSVDVGGEVIEIPRDSGEKDPSDYTRRFGLDNLKNLVDSLCKTICLEPTV